MIAGGCPADLGRFEIHAPEMMFVQYMPIAMPASPNPPPGAWSNGTSLRVPPHLSCFMPLIAAAFNDGMTSHGQYMYLTAKRLYVTPERSFNRPGWHIDGFGTNDLNYIWCDHAPTEFCIQPFDLSDDCEKSMAQMEAQARPDRTYTFQPRHLLRLDNTVVHRPLRRPEPGYRTFVKISISHDRYNLIGNAHNYLFDYEWEMVERGVRRNHPTARAPGASKHVIRPISTQRFHDDGRHETFYACTCPACGAASDPYGNLPCACGQQEQSA